MVPEGVVRPNGSAGEFAAVVGAAGEGKICPNASPGEVRQAPRHTIQTRMYLGKEGMIFTRPALCRRAISGR
jgi:hypothetical protein